MPTYLIEGKKVRAEKPLTDAEIDEIAASVRAPTPSPAPAAPSEIPAARAPSGFFERMASVGPSVGLVDVTTPSRLTPQQLEQSAREQASAGLGLIAGPVLAAGSRALGAAIPAIQRFTAPLATAFETGGFQTGLGKETPRAVRLGARVVGGAVPGAIGGIPVGESGTGAAIGGGAALLAPPVVNILAKGTGSVIDALAGRTADVRANELIRLAANDEVNALRAAMQANPDVPASRAAANMDLPVLQALLQRAEKADPKQVVNAFRQRESQDVVNELTRIAGGPTAETARTARESAKGSLRGITTPIREEALGAARETGEVMPKLQTIAAEARADVKKNTDLVRRVSGLVNKAEDWATNWIQQRGVGEAGVRLPERVVATSTFPGQLAASGRQTTTGGPFERMVVDEGGAVARRTGAAAEASLQAGARARAAENTLQSMKDRGLQPITLNKFTGPIDRLMANPEIATDETLQQALPRVRQMFEDWANEFGVISPEAVYAIRKNGVNSIIQKLMPTADTKAQSRMAAQVLSKLRPAIDDAIVQAGGKNWPAYLESFEQGTSAIKGMELADQIRKLYANGKKQEIIDLVRGESPDVIEDLFGSGRYKISEEMAKDMPLLRRIADTAELDLKTVEQAAAGRAALRTAEQEAGWKIRLPFFTRFTTATNEAIAALEKKMKDETLEVLIRAAQSGREFNRVLDTIPAKERSAFLAQFKNRESWNKFSVAVANAARAYAVGQTGEQPDVTVERIGNQLIQQPNVNAMRPQP